MDIRPATETRAADGVLLVDKPGRMTSHDVVAVARRAMRVRRVGHAGTLDPAATGLLVLLVGRGTRLMPYIDAEPKVYHATIRFGSETDTDDATGQVTRESTPPALDAIHGAIARLTGVIEQVPPAYSAKKVGGARAYAQARRGAPVALSPTRVIVHAWDVLHHRHDSIDARIVCSGGTYIRALARDLGRLTDSAAHLFALRRISSGPFHVEDATTVDDLRSGRVVLLPLRAAIASMAAQTVDAAAAARVVHGNAIAAQVAGAHVALIDEGGDLIGVAERSGDDLHPRLVLRNA
jgi:tRNA pseudouridine55 synthase